MGIGDRIEDLEDKLQETPVNKATEKERGRLKAQIAQLKEERQKKQKGTGETSGYAVEKTGDATVALVGFPSVGKSTLLNELTNAEVDTGAYEFTTLEVNPGILKYKGASIQILDVPGLIGGAAEGRGGGTQVLSVVRNADLILVVLDPGEMRSDEITGEVYKAGLRTDVEPPNMKIEKKDRGGIGISSTVDLDLDDSTIKDLMRQNGYGNAEVIIREEMGIDRFIDGLMDNRIYLPSLKIVNKSDSIESSRKEDLRRDFDLLVSAETGENLDVLKDRMFEEIGLIRVYMKEKNKEPDKEEPLMLRRGDSVEDALQSLPGDMRDKFKHARVTGTSSDFPEQKVGMTHELHDEDVLQLNLKRI